MIYRKPFVIYLTILIIILLSSCQSTFKFELSKSLGEVDTIEIIEIFSDSGEEKVLNKLDIEKASLLIDEIKKLSCYKDWNDPCQTLNGIAIKVIYFDGNYEIITSCANAVYSNGRISYGREYFDKSAFDDLITKYIEG